MRNTIRTAARPEHEILGAILRELREKAGLSQRQVAAQLGRTQAYVWKLESGTQHVDVATLVDLGRILQTHASEIIRRLESDARGLI